MLSDERADQLFAADYACQKCGAPASEPCLTPNRRIAGMYHKERRETAIKERQGPRIGDVLFADDYKHRVAIGGSELDDLIVFSRRSFERHVRRRFLSWDAVAGMWRLDEKAARSAAS